MRNKRNFMTVWILSKRTSENSRGEDIIAVFSSNPTNEQLMKEGIDEYDAESLLKLRCSYWYVLREYELQ